MKNKNFVQSNNLSLAWAEAFMTISEETGGQIMPFMISITGFDGDQPEELSTIREILDDTLAEEGKASCGTVANTIFPDSLWYPEAGREKLYARYYRLVPRLKKVCRANLHGTYFERLIDFRNEKERNAGVDVRNQLEQIISTFLGLVHKPNHRHSALVAAIFNPDEDHSDQQQRGFPCMHHVTFEQHGDSGLGITGIYATQYYFSKAYGNLLGLSRLGRFMAHAMGKKLRTSYMHSEPG